MLNASARAARIFWRSQRCLASKSQKGNSSRSVLPHPCAHVKKLAIQGTSGKHPAGKRLKCQWESAA
eukprot:6036554-Amphidinium_carterae.2